MNESVGGPKKRDVVDNMPYKHIIYLSSGPGASIDERELAKGTRSGMGVYTDIYQLFMSTLYST